MKSNKIFTILAASSLAFTLASCNDDDSSGNNNGGNTDNICDCTNNLNACSAEE